MRVLSVVGNRPQFIKSAPLSVALREAGIDETVVHTGQHWDDGMSQVFYDELSIPPPAHVEAGLRSFDLSMPEERNRIEVDRAATLLFCPDERSARQLEAEGVT